MSNLSARLMCIPDGMLRTASARRVRLSLFLTPVPGDGLEDLPNTVSAWMDNNAPSLKIWHGAGSNRTPIDDRQVLPNWLPQGALSKANAIWKVIFKTMPGGGDGFATLTRLLNNLHAERAAQQRTDSVDSDTMVFAPRAALHDHLDQLRDDHLNLHSLAHITSKTGTTHNLAGLALRRRPFHDPLRAHKQRLSQALVPPELRAGAIGRMHALREVHRKPGETSPSFGNAKQLLVKACNDLAKGTSHVLESGEPSPLDVIRGLKDGSSRRQVHSRGDGLQDYDEIGQLFLYHLAAHDLANPHEGKTPTARAAVPDAHEDAVSRKYSAIRALPTLAKFLGLIVDVEFEAPQDWDREPKQLIAAEFVAGNPKPFDELDRTAFHFAPSAGLFVARQREGASDDIKVENGVVRLAEKNETARKNRFSIRQADQDLLLQSLIHQATADEHAASTGGSPAGPSIGMPEAITRGIQLFDEWAPEVARRAKIRKQELNKPSALYYAEDICIGYRPDVLRLRGGTTEVDWAPLMARLLRIDDVWSAMLPAGAPADRHPYDAYDRMRDRDHGLVRPMAKTVPGDDRTRKPSPSEILFTWKGDSLGVPSALSDATAQIEPHDGTEDLPLSMSFEYSPVSEDRPAVLRFGDSYAFGMRAVMPNGACIPLAAAKAIYGSTSTGGLSQTYTLGDACGTPTIFRYAENTHAPTVLLPSNDPVALAKAGPGESDHHIVLRSNSLANQSRVLRYLVPTRRSFEFSELHGLFDTHLNEAAPLGAFRSFRRNASGNFPAVHNAHPTPEDKKTTPVDGMTLAKCPTVGAEENPYYPDPNSHNVVFGLERNGAYPPNFPQQNASQRFWRKTQTALDARPILIDVSAASGDNSNAQPDDIEKIASGAFPQLKITLAKGEQATLWFWALPDQDRLDKSHKAFAFAKAMAVNTGGGAPAASDGAAANVVVAGPNDLVFDAVMQTPFNGYTGSWGTITLTHAIEKPLATPAFLKAPSVVRLPAETGLRGRQALLDSHQPAGATAVYFSGELEFNRLTTGEVGLEIAWMDWSTGGPVKNETTGQFEFKPQYQQQPVFRVTSIPIDCGARAPGAKSRNCPTVFDLEFREDDVLRGITHDFRDTAARRLAIRAFATSRFVNFFEKREKDPFQFELSSRPPFDPAKGLDFSKEISCWALSSRRPPPPVIDRIEWITSQQQETGPGGVQSVTTRCLPRVYFKGKWFVQGQDELLAVVFQEGTIASNIGFDGTNGFTYDDPALSVPNTDDTARQATLGRHMSEYGGDDPDKALLRQFVTRWGADPIINGGVLSAFMPAEQFTGFAGRVASVLMPVSQPPKAGAPSTDSASAVGNDSTVDPIDIPVSALLYRVELDPRTHEHYVDLPIEAETVPGTALGAHNPFVSLVLTRFQPHSEDGLWMSEPAVHDAIQIPASRKVTIAAAGPSTLSVKIEGRGYDGRAPYLDEHEVRVSDADKARLSLPLMNVQLLRESARTGKFIAAFDARGRRVERQAAGLDMRSMLYMPPNIVNGPTLTWSADIELPLPLKDQRYAVQIDEVELHVPDANIEFRQLQDTNWSLWAERPDIDGNFPDPKSQNTMQLAAKPNMFSFRALVN